MKVIIHAGAHSTEEDRLMKTLLRNKEDLLACGTSVPGPAKYRNLLKDCMSAARTNAPSEFAGDLLWDAILEDETAQRVILSNPHFFGSPREALDGQRLYPEAEERLVCLDTFFDEDELELFMAIRSPAGFLPGLLEKASPARRKTVCNEADPQSLRWSSLFLRVRAILPDLPITVWCYEDMPIIWAQILREIGGLEEDTKVAGGLDMLASIMTPEGMTRLRHYLHLHPEMTESYKHRIFAAFLDKYALEDEIEEELDMPDWTPEFIEEIEIAYDQDVAAIREIPGVTLLQPALPIEP